MVLYTKDAAGRVLTSLRFSGGEPIEFILVDGFLSDQGRAYYAVRLATVHCGFIADVYKQWARDIIPGFGVQYLYGVFSIDGVTEEMVEDAVIRLANVVLLFYGVALIRCKKKKMRNNGKNSSQSCW